MEPVLVFGPSVDGAPNQLLVLRGPDFNPAVPSHRPAVLSAPSSTRSHL